MAIAAVFEVRRAPEAGEFEEHLVHVLADVLVASEQAEVGVQTRGARVVVAGAKVHVVAQVAVSSRRTTSIILAWVL